VTEYVHQHNTAMQSTVTATVDITPLSAIITRLLRTACHIT